MLGGLVLDALYHLTTILPLSAATQAGLFPVGSLSHVMVIVGFDVAIVGAARSRYRAVPPPVQDHGG